MPTPGTPETKIDVLDNGFVRYVGHMGTDICITEAARVSYSKGTRPLRDDITLLRYLMRHKHYSPFAQCTLKLHLRMPCFVRDQLIRHDRFHWNIMSARYSVMPDEKWTPKPNEFRAQSTTNKQVGSGKLPEDIQELAVSTYLLAMTQAQEAYERLLALGVCREQARGVLPFAQYTEAYVTANLGDWLLMLSQRLDSHAQTECRAFAEAIAEIIKILFPITYQAFCDYQKNAMTFSSLELETMSNSINVIEDYSKDETYLSMTNREQQEFKQKLAIGLIL